MTPAPPAEITYDGDVLVVTSGSSEIAVFSIGPDLVLEFGTDTEGFACVYVSGEERKRVVDYLALAEAELERIEAASDGWEWQQGWPPFASFEIYTTASRERRGHLTVGPVYVARDDSRHGDVLLQLIASVEGAGGASITLGLDDVFGLRGQIEEGL